MSGQAEERGVAAITGILTHHPGSRVAIGTHGGLMTLIMGHYHRRLTRNSCGGCRGQPSIN